MITRTIWAPISSFSGGLIAVIGRSAKIEEKWVVTTSAATFSLIKIEKANPVDGPQWFAFNIELA